MSIVARVDRHNSIGVPEGYPSLFQTTENDSAVCIPNPQGGRRPLFYIFDNFEGEGGMIGAQGGYRRALELNETLTLELAGISFDMMGTMTFK